MGYQPLITPCCTHRCVFLGDRPGEAHKKIYTPPPPSTHFFDLLTKEYGITVDIRERWQDLQYPKHGWPHYNPDDRRVGLGAGRDELEVVEPEPELGGEEGAKEKQST